MNSKNVTVSGSSSLERLVPDDIVQGESTGETTLELHLARYEWAAANIKKDNSLRRILDAACGVGYGSAILDSCKSDVEITGVDIDAAAIAYASERYGSSSIKFTHSDISELGGNSNFDAIVSLETIEHVTDPVATIHNFWKLLRQDGLFIMSVPVTPSVDVNPYHLTDFSVASIREILKAGKFEIIDELLQIQPFNPVKILTKQESRVEDIREKLLWYYMKNPTACIKRIYATLRFGFSNRYLTLACRKLG
jgi:SAM-dependent methyltransferase